MKFIQICTAVSADGRSNVLFALDDNGVVWERYVGLDAQWKQVSSPRLEAISREAELRDQIRKLDV